MTKDKKAWNHILLVLVLFTASIIALGFLLYAFTPFKFIADSVVKPNYAQQVAEPIEESLADAGAVKISSGGDGGYGLGNRSPGYGAMYEVPLNESDTISLMTKIATQNGFTLTHATTENRGPITVDDKYVDNWYYDVTSKDAEPPNLSQGKVELKIEINVEDSDTSSNRTTIRFDVSLPNFK